MSISEGLLTGLWLWWLHAIYGLALGYAFYRAPWRTVVSNKGLQHLFFGATVLLALMWSMRAGISPGLSIHFLGMTTLTLILGWDLAVLSGSLVLLAMTLIGKESWDGLSANGLCLVIIPALLSHVIHQWVERLFGKNFFIYLFLCAFLGSAIIIAISGLSMSLLLWFDGVYPWNKIEHEYVRYLPLIMFPEALMNGILMTGIMVFYPDWIRTFDAKAYIDEQ
ncbi:energy-coupling factor ABC transporter permease [Neptunomonas concharum]|uniref:Energy-coupling factor ABC transporter permease n=1 Tax=Neptunomonas concharum TaxID=1031538 RepID=A0A5P1R7R4_9GAMM|nr:energy-coupling factor ABC transporter permease [Neptunomonas concharum]QEQ95699.1 hypothetical protein F0U83_02685 [Neptunomonas concharum]